MPLLDNEFHSSSRRSRRAHSWYMYEQYKSLERNQAEAAQKMNEKMWQKIQLRREMSEHRERRRMCGGCCSEPSVDQLRNSGGAAALFSAPSISDIFHSLCQDDEFTNAADEAEVTSTQESCRWSEGDGEPHIAPSRFSEPRRYEDSVPLPRSILKSSIGNRSSCVSNLADDLEQSFSTYHDKDLFAPSIGYLTPNKEVSPEIFGRTSGCSEPKRYEASIPLPRAVFNNSTGHIISSCKLEDNCGPVFPTSNNDNLLLAPPTSDLSDDRDEILSVSSSKHANEADSNSNLADDIKEAMKYVKRSIAENIQHQLEMKENVESLEGLTNLNGTKYMKVLSFRDKDANVTDDDEKRSLRLHHTLSDQDMTKENFAMWAKFVSFAYQVIQLNHGNCYYDYSSLLMTGVLACDIIRRGIRLVCNVLQPYVSPIKYVSNTGSSSGLRNSTNTIKKAKNTRTPLSQLQKNNPSGFKPQRNHLRGRGGKVSSPIKLIKRGDTTSAEKLCWAGDKTPIDNPTKKLVAWQSLSTHPSVTLPSEKQSCYQELNSKDSFNSCSTRVTNPMLNIATYIDSIVEFGGDSNL